MILKKDMIIKTSKEFDAKYILRIRKNDRLRRETIQAIELFKQDPNSEVLANHQLYGQMQGLWSFSINGDYRIIYILSDNGKVARFLDIGTHDDVYYS